MALLQKITPALRGLFYWVRLGNLIVSERFDIVIDDHRRLAL